MNRTDDIRAVAELIGRYTKGTEDRNVDMLRRAFHENATMAGYLGPNKLIGSPQPFFDHIAANEHSPGYTSEISGIEITGRTAIVRVLEDNLYGMSFVSDFHVMKDDETWIITAKLFHHD